MIVVSVTTDRSLLNHTLYIIIFNVNVDLHRPYSLCTAHIFDIYVGLLKLASVISMGTKQAACQLVFDHKVEVAWKSHVRIVKSHATTKTSGQQVNFDL